MNVLILEDENRAARHLQRLLKAVDPQIRTVDVLDTIRDATAFLKDPPVPIELVFSDVQLADGICFEIFRKVDVQVPVIFTTAYDQYAIEAFNTSGIDYLLKPLEEDRLRKAIQKAKQFSAALGGKEIMALAEIAQGRTYKSRFLVKVGEQIKIIPVEEVHVFYTVQKSTFLLTGSGRSYPVDFSLDVLQSKLDPDQFFRISRKSLVSVTACAQVHSWPGNRLKLKIEGLDESLLLVSRDRAAEFKQWLDH